MSTPKVLLKRSSVVGRIPDSSDLQYGELAINFADGKLYYKDDSNNIKAFIDSARVQAIADAVETVAQAQLDSGETTTLVTSLVDSNYVQSRTNELYLATIIDSAYVQARQVDLQRDSSFITSVIDGTYIIGIVDQIYIRDNQILYNTSDFLDSETVSFVVDSAYIAARQAAGTDSPTVLSLIAANSIDSADVTALIDSAYVQARQIKYNTSDFTDSAGVSDIILGDVSAAYVQARQIKYNTSDFVDSDTVSLVIDSAYVQARADSDYITNAITQNLDVGEIILGLDPGIDVVKNPSDFTATLSTQLSAGTGLTKSGGSGWGDPVTFDIDSNSTVTINRVVADSGEIKLINFDENVYTDVSVPDNLPTFEEGNLFYFQGPDALTYSNASINVKIGQDEIVRVYNNSGSDIAKGKAVYVTGAANDFPTISLAKADNFSTIYTTIGLTSHAITNGAFGFVTMRGLYGGLNTTSFNAGDIVHVSVDSAGELTNSQPAYPNFPFEIGTVLVSDSPGGGNVGGCIQVNLKAEVFEGIRVQGNSRFDADLTVAGNLNILGAETITQVQNLQVTDNFIYIGAGDTVTTLFDGTGTNDGLIKDYYEGDSSKYYFVYIYDADSVNGGDLIRLERGDSAGAFDDGTSVQINFDSAGGSETLDLSVDRTLLPLRNNIKVTFETAGGHDSGDYWYGLAAPVNQDLGIVGNYNLPDAPYSHAGFFRDADDQKFKVFNKYDPEVTGNINTSHASFELGTMVAQTFEGNLTGNVTGTVSDISNHSTTELSEGNNLYYTTARHDSDTLIQVNSAYVQSRQTSYNTSDFTDSAFVTGLPVSTFTNDVQYLDSTTVTGVIDAAYTQTNQIKYNTSDFTDSAFVTGLPVSTFTNDANYLDSTTVAGVIDATFINALTIDADTLGGQNSAYHLNYNNFTNTPATVDSAYVQFRILDNNDAITGLQSTQFNFDSDQTEFTVTVAAKDATHRYNGQGSGNGYKIDGTFAPTIVLVPGNTYRFDQADASNSGHPLAFYYEADKTTSYSTNVTTNGTPGSAGAYTEIEVTDATPMVLHYQCTAHAYMGNMVATQTRNFTGFDTDDLSEGSTNQYYTNTRANSAIDARVDKTFVDNLGIAYTSLSGTPTIPTLGNDFVDSAQVEAIVDSAYVQARQSGGAITVQEEGTPLSTAATTLNFVGSAVTATGSGATKTITITGGGAGGTDSAAIIQLIDSAYVRARQLNAESVTELDQTTFYYTAAAGDSSFSGADDFGNTLSYSSSKVQVYINGILQVKTSDFTANNGTSVSLVEAADSGDIIAVETITGNTANTRLQLQTFVFTADSGDNNFGGADDNGLTLDYTTGRISVFLNGILLLDSADYTATNGLNIITEALDSGDVLTIQQFTGTNIGVDSAEARTIARTLVDSAYVQLRQSGGEITIQEEGSPLSTGATTLNFVGDNVTATGSGATKTITISGGAGTDSSQVINIIDDQLAVFTVGDLVGADGNPGDMLVSDGDGTASWTGNGALSYEFKVNYDSLGVISTVTDLPTGWTDSVSGSTVIINHNTGRSVKDISYNSYVSGTLKLRKPSADSADAVTYAVADRLNKFTATVGIANTNADADQYAWVNIIF